MKIDPLIAAISAGNCAIVKPSELSPATSKLIGDIISNNFEQSYIAVAEGGKEISEALLSEQFDYIFFTRSTSIGRIVMQKAAENLTPVTLELGGKSPCIIDKSADIELAVKRILFGKIINSGQTCVAPDYLLVHADIKDKIKDAFVKYSTKMLGKNALENKSYP
ncbi:MAG: aldehyde dehydrogenase family protein, partial [Paludibacteraceae bacterium]|nr:aldehyde dehydrogenase family protein [Paludibacteraceae bacterium]